eukprot:gnl/MRDRNA2_/MRDRNA2_140034_c0_seq1.p1 gnl/MRDRNA2_/MRDRNA2_140034_c0~~gnl/MRDRNA2_/MRDRNA2_140034_c0_seq1.p1  ORF type:complete len:577 (-),score=108.07 gnl/MRDRNA2_/MRDRNA2_140034_c0_seq1:21-1595(-)
MALGSGFVVQAEPYPLFVTNAHVVTDAHEITLQFLAHSSKEWQATVVSICSEFDIALLVLKQPASFTKALQQKNVELIPLPLETRVPFMGSHVVSVGFPLGQTSLKIAEGNVAGNEVVFGYISLQSTAPISPGSSGGPLLNANGTSVVGINFASATDGENVNFVVPSWRVQQMIDLHQEEQGNKPARELQRRQVHIPQPDLVHIQANKALYSISGGCHSGVYMPMFGNWSYFRMAVPPVPWQSFLVSVNGVKLDQFGMGSNPNYVSDSVLFTDLVWMKESFSKNFTFATCKEGIKTEHTASLSWQPEFDIGIVGVEEPTFAKIQYEVFGDLTIMEMTQNHIEQFLLSGGTQLAHWLHPDVSYSPRLVVSATEPGSYAEEILPVGAVVEKVNGHIVRTLKDYRDHFIPSNESAVWTLETDSGDVYAAFFKDVLEVQIALALQEFDRSKLTKAVVAAAEKLKISTILDFTGVANLQEVPDAGRRNLSRNDVQAAGPKFVSKESRGYKKAATNRLRKMHGGLQRSCN